MVIPPSLANEPGASGTSAEYQQDGVAIRPGVASNDDRSYPHLGHAIGTVTT